MYIYIAIYIAHASQYLFNQKMFAPVKQVMIAPLGRLLRKLDKL